MTTWGISAILLDFPVALLSEVQHNTVSTYIVCPYTKLKSQAWVYYAMKLNLSSQL